MESDLIAWLRKRLPKYDNLLLGPGDDAALLRWPAAAGVVVTVDVLMDGIDFELAKIDPVRVGRKSLAVNLSDLAAMAAVPVAAVIGLVLPRSGGEQLAHQLYEGLLPLAEKYHVAIAGGDVNSWDGPLVISVTVLGEPTSRGVTKRSGACPGDWIIVTGSFGGSLLGRHLDFEPRVREALVLNERYEIHASIDVSDGLSRDVTHLAEESGCGLCLETAAVPIAPAAYELAASRADARTPLEHALGDGEDFELILAVPPADAERMLADHRLDVSLTRIGQFTADAGCWQIDAQGRRSPLVALGYEHRLDR